jgi:hypothetical protein
MKTIRAGLWESIPVTSIAIGGTKLAHNLKVI